MKAKLLALAALVLGLASCQTDPEGINVDANGEAAVTISVGIPDTDTRAGGNDSAVGAFDNVDFSKYDVRYILEVYNLEGDLEGKLAKERMVNTEDEAMETSFTLRLIPGRDYRFVVWADIVEEGKETDLHYVTTDLKDIQFTNLLWNLSDETRDAYTGIWDEEKFSNTSNIGIELKRPLGKLRVVTTDIKDMFNVLPEEVTVLYTSSLYTKFNAFTSQVVSDSKAYALNPKTINISENKYTNEWNDEGKVKENLTLFADYYFAANEQEPITFTLDVKDNIDMAIPQVVFNTPIPIQRNYLTTVMGPVLTDANSITVTVNDAFNIPENVVDADVKDELEEAAKHKNYVIDLKGDLIWETGGAHGSTPLIPEGAVTETLTINGNGYKVIATGAGVGPIRMANGGKLIFNEVTLVDQTKSYAEDSWEFGYLEVAGNLEFNNCVIDNTIAIDGEKAVFNNCTFNDKVFAGTEGQEYAAWVSNGEVEFNGCKFSGARGIKVHEAYGSEVVEVVVDNCQFNNLSKKPGMAIGTVNAATKIEIKNSVFNNCQPGDQGLFMYETDTNVTTFDFSQTNNTVNAVVASSEVFAKVMKANFHTLNISLNADVAVDVNANVADFYFGGNNTNVITIDGAKVATAAATGAGDNAYTLTFNHKNSDWNYVRLANADAKLVIKNAKLTNSGNNNGPWNRHDISFYNDVELVNVTSDKAIALFGDSDLTNVIISDVHPDNSEAYALWIRPFGQTVNINNCALLAHESKTTDRGIKIDNQYVDAEAKVTLNVDGLKVKSQKKAAIVVKSTAGADITLKNVDLSEVAADTENAVWVDSSTKQYAGLVSVTGASMIVEGQEDQIISTKESLKTALEAAGAAGAGNTTLILAKDAEIDMTDAEWEPIYVNGYNGADIVTVVGNGATLKGLTAPLFKGGFAGGSGIVIRDLTITESNIVSESTQGSGAFIECADSMETITLENCHFTNSSISGSRTGGLIGWTSGYSNQNDGPVKTYVTIKNCSVVGVEINATGSAGAINGHAGASDWTYTTIENCTVKDCNINSTDSGDWRTGVVVGTANVGEVTINNITESGNTLTQTGKTAPEGYKRNYYGRAVLGTTGKLTIDGNEYGAGLTYLADGLTKADGSVTYNVSNANGLAVLNGMMANKTAGKGIVVNLSADINFAGYTWTPVDSHADTSFSFAELNGNGHTISNFTINGQAMFKRFAGSGDVTVKDVTFDNASVTSTAINTSILTVQTYQNVLLDNVDVRNSSINGGYKVAPLIATVYNENPVTTITATLKNCDVENVTVKATSYDFCTTGMVAFVYADDNDTIEFENCTVKDVKLMAPNDSYKAHAAIYTTGSGSLYNEAEGVTVTNVTFEAL